MSVHSPADMIGQAVGDSCESIGVASATPWQRPGSVRAQPPGHTGPTRCAVGTTLKTRRHAASVTLCFDADRCGKHTYMEETKLLAALIISV